MKTLVTLATYKKSKTADFLKQILEQNNIDCFFALTFIIKQKSEEFKVQVKEEDVENAIRIMLGIKEKYGKEIEDIEPDLHVRKIIVPTDFSEGSENACYYAVHLAQKLQAEIKILHVFENPIGEVRIRETAAFEDFSLQLHMETEKKVKTAIVAFTQKIKDYMISHGIQNVRVHSTTIMGNIVGRIKGISSLYHPDLLVLGTVGKRESSDSVLAGVANEIIKGLGIPVYAIPGPINYRDLEKLNILYATDFNEKDHTSLDKLLEIVGHFQKGITCVHIDTERNPAKKERMYELNDFLKKEYSEHDILCHLIEDEDVYYGIKDFAESNGINLLSFTTQKRNIFKALFKPNLFKKILQEANLPILIFPS